MNMHDYRDEYDYEIDQAREMFGLTDGVAERLTLGDVFHELLCITLTSIAVISIVGTIASIFGPDQTREAQLRPADFATSMERPMK